MESNRLISSNKNYSQILNVKTIVIKIGSSILIDPKKNILKNKWLNSLLEEIAFLKRNGKIYLFANKSKIRNLFSNDSFKKVKVINENNTNIFLKELNSKKIIIDRLSCSLAYENTIKNKINISYTNDPIYNLKSIKNSIEIKNFINSHILGVHNILEVLRKKV